MSSRNWVVVSSVPMTVVEIADPARVRILKRSQLEAELVCADPF
jgi:hypothetical protein